MLIDSYGRTLDYLRVSITDRCNLRCIYCMPKEGVEWKSHEEMLSFEEILRICRIMAELGIRKFKITGGEPLVRRGAAGFLKNLRAIPGTEKITLTTNGLLLGAFLDETRALDVLPDGVNISLDSLDSGRFAHLTRTDGMNPHEILRLVDLLFEKHVSVKINCVPVRSINEEDILPLAALAKDRDICVRFIELMPLGAASAFMPIPGGEIASIIEKAFGNLELSTDKKGNGPAVYYSLPGFSGKIGFINPLTHGFCETCNRLRLTSEGFLKPCLSYDLGLDLRQLLRSGASDSELTLAITDAAAKKPKSHSLSDIYGPIPDGEQGQHGDGMFGIGG